jgi:PAS domain S-box-containing protein
MSTKRGILKNVSIGTRLLIGFSFMVLALVTVTGAGIQSLSGSSEQLENVNRIAGLQGGVARILLDLKNIDALMNALILADTAAERDTLGRRVADFRKDYQENLELVGSNTRTRGGKKLLSEFKDALAAGVTLNKRLDAWIQAGDEVRFRSLMSGGGESVIQLRAKAGDALLDYLTKRTALRMASARAGSESSIFMMFGLGAAALGLSLLTFLGLSRGLRSERALKESEARFHAIFNQSPMVIFLTDPLTGNFVDVNERFCETSGFSKEAAVGKSSVELGLSDPNQRIRIMEMLRNDGFIDRAEVTSSDCAGNSNVFLLSARLIEANGATYALSTLLDITARKQAENALRDSEEQQRLYLSRLPIACILWSRDFRVQSWNPAAERIFGFSAAEALGRSANDLIVPDWAQVTTGPIWARLMEGSLCPTSTNENVTKDGRVVTIEWTNTPVCDTPGRVAAVLSIAQDVTERKRAEAVMIQSEKMSMVAAMAAGTAHEVNNPLGIIAQDLQNLERRLSSALPANCKVAGELGLDLDLVEQYLERRDIHCYVTSMQAAVKRATAIISNMLQFSRLSDASRQLVNLNEVVDQSVQLAASDCDLRQKYDFKKVALKRSYCGELPVVMVCVTEMEQVFINLLQNAAQAMSEAGTEHPCIFLETSCADGQVSVSVRDNGPGMNEAVRKRIFDPFFTTKDVGSGTGLGLSVSYSIVSKNHDGEISVVSAPGQGACFSVHLPVYQRSSIPCLL